MAFVFVLLRCWRAIKTVVPVSINIMSIVSKILVYIFPVSHTHNKHQKHLLLDLVYYPIVTNPVSPQVVFASSFFEPSGYGLSFSK